MYKAKNISCVRQRNVLLTFMLWKKQCFFQLEIWWCFFFFFFWLCFFLCRLYGGMNYRRLGGGVGVIKMTHCESHIWWTHRRRSCISSSVFWSALTLELCTALENTKQILFFAGASTCGNANTVKVLHLQDATFAQ